MLSKFQLRNGMTVILAESHKSPVVSAQMWVDTGSADEGRGEEGISHFIEHLVFKGTDKYKVGEIASLVEGSGGELNAYTSFDQTVFYVTISKQFQDVALDVIQQMMGMPTFLKEEIDNERDVVIEEIKRGNDSPGRRSSRLLFESAYKKHPYRVPVIGFEKNIRTMSPRKIREYYDSRYVPENMTFLVTGDFDSKEMRKKVEAQFGLFPKRKLLRKKRPQEVTQKSPRIVVQQGPFQEGLFNIGWRIPNIYHKDIPAIDVLSMILGYGDSSRLTRGLRLERPLVNSVGAGSYTPKDEGLLTISGGFNTQQWKDILDQLGLELLEFVVYGPTEEEVERTKFQLESDELYSMETVDGMSNKIGTFQTLFGDPHYFTKVYLERIRKLTARDITQAARKYISAKGLNLTVLTPDRDKELREVAESWAADLNIALRVFQKSPLLAAGSQSMKAPVPLKSTKVVPTGSFELLSMGQLKNTVVRQIGETSVLSFRAAFHGAQRQETAANSGLHEMISSVWTSGTAHSTEAEIAVRAEQLAAGLRAFSGRNTIGLSLDCLAPTADKAFELFLEVLTAPTFPEVAFEREKQVHLEHLRSRDDNPAQVAMQKFNSLMFRGHVYELDSSGTQESVTSLRASQATESYRKTVGLDNLSLSVVGRFDSSQLQSWMGQIQSKLGRNANLFTEMKWHPPRAPVRHFELTKKEQSHIILGFPGLTIRDPRRYALQVMQSVLAGQGGRLFLSLRDKASLAYSLSPMKMEGIDAGFFGTYIGCSPEKGKKAIEMMRVELKKLCEDKISPAELERSQRYIIGRHDIELQRNSSIATTCLFDHMFGLGYDHLNSVVEKIRTVTAEQIRELSQELFSGPEIISVAGSEQPWD